MLQPTEMRDAAAYGIRHTHLVRGGSLMLRPTEMCDAAAHSNPQGANPLSPGVAQSDIVVVQRATR